MYFVYLLRSVRNGKSYVGRTSKTPESRLKEHNLGSNNWTKRNGPFKLVYYERYHCLADAIEREKFFKSGIGKGIKKLIANKTEVNSSGSSSVG